LACFETDGLGNIRLLRSYEGWSRSWTHIVAGQFADGSYSSLLFYDQGAGLAVQYACQGDGELVELAAEDFWRPSWNIIVAGRFSASPYDGLLLYDRAAGFGAFYATSGQGRTELLAEHDDWRSSWTGIVAGNWAADDWNPPEKSDLFFYEGETGYGETYFCNAADDLIQVGGQYGFPVDARVIAGNFGGPYYLPWTNLIFLDEALTQGQVWYAAGFPAREGERDPHDHRSFMPDPHALNWLPTEALDLGGKSYTHVAAANFWAADPEDRNFDGGGFIDLAFYGSASGDLDIYLKEPPPQPLDALMGYPSCNSARPGETITFHVSSTVGPFTLDVYRLGAVERHMRSLAVAPGAGGPYPITRNAWRYGAGWPAAAALCVPSDWPSGLYVARVVADPFLGPVPGSAAVSARQASPATLTNPSRGDGMAARRPPKLTYDIPFVVRSPWPGTTASILVGVPDTTYEAYNFWGGRSLYTGGSGGRAIWVDPYSRFRAPRGFRVSFRRGFRSVDGRAMPNGKWKVWEVPLLAWLERQGITVDLCVMSDLDRDPSVLDGYRLFVSIGHDEYWSQAMRSRVEAHLNQGGNVAFLSGNTCYWQIRFERDGDTMVCYKRAEFDPTSTSDAAHTTVQWTESPVNNSERKLTGVSGAYLYDPESIFFDPQYPEVIRVYTVTAADHWVYEGTDLANGNVFGLYRRPDGEIRTALGPETDVRAHETPSSFRQLAAMYYPSGEVRGEMVIREGSRGTVFSAATMDWCRGLMSDDLYPAISQITLNVLRRLGGA
jgi:hypothetical protein